MWLFIYSIIVLLYWVALSGYLLYNGQKIKYLFTIADLKMDSSPSVIIIIAMRNEEKTIRDALSTVCKLNYPNYKVLVVNDRSTDRSYEIIKEFQQANTKIQILNIQTLPPGWLGKNHALYSGYQNSSEEYLLFTDADVLYMPDVLSKAMQYVQQNHLDHLTILPGIISDNSILKSILSTFVIMLSAWQRPWAAKDKTSKASMGVGAFNLVKRTAYEKSGTHKSISMRPDDDLKLAEQLKKAGASADVLYGIGEIELEWYATVKEFINGLMKNSFSGLDYSIMKMIGAVSGILVFFVLPIPGILIFGTNTERVLIALMFCFQLTLYKNMQGTAGKGWYALMSIYAGLILCYIMIRAAFITSLKGGIVWRDTFYSLKELKGNSF